MEAFDMSHHPVTFQSTLAELYPPLAGSPVAELAVTGMCSDSRAVQPGWLFVAMPGLSTDGRDYIDQAVRNGAAAVFAQAQDGFAMHLDGAVPVVDVPALQALVSQLAARFYQSPGDALDLVAVTGTNGKTSCSQMIAAVASRLGLAAGVVGSLGYGRSGTALAETGLTTPEAVQMQRCLAELLADDCQLVATEVSSHALVQFRVAAVPFRTAVFTCLSRDHLDYHETMTAYADAKRQLFYFDSLERAVINIDDEFGRELYAELAGRVSRLSYSLHDQAADFWLSGISYSLSGIEATLHHGEECAALSLQLIGQFNLANALAVAATLVGPGVTLAAVADALSRQQPIAGRMQMLCAPATREAAVSADITRLQQSDITVVIDYAHTPDALAQALSALQPHSQARLHCLFGCGGDRDRGKRALMGRAAAALADSLVVTSDNPRSEPPQQIIDDILLGIDDPSDVYIEADRKTAIEQLIGTAGAGDIVLVAGKGHENYQEIAGRKLPFSDHAIALQALDQRRGVNP